MNTNQIQTSADSVHDRDTRCELKSSWPASLLILLYASQWGPFVASRRRMVRRLILKLENGEMQSSTLRIIMRRYHGVDVSAHAYGCFDPIRFPPGTRIGRYASIGPDVAIYRRNHPLDRLSLHPYFYRPDLSDGEVEDVATVPLEIAEDAWVGARALIVPGCHRIGRGAVIAAGAVVTRDVPDYAVVAGNPARLVRYRFEDSCRDEADRSAWWSKTPAAVTADQNMNTAWVQRGEAVVS